MRILRRELRTGAAHVNRVTEIQFARTGDHLISERTFSLCGLVRSSRWRSCSAVFFLLAMWALGGSKASGASRVWNGTLNTDFELAANWNVLLPPSAPANDLTTDIGVFSGAVPANQPTLTVSRSINALQFTTASGGWILGGAFTLSLGSGGINTTGQTSGTNTISVNVQLAAASTWLVGTGGTLLVSGQVSSSGAFGLTVNNGSNAGTLKLNGANTYTGGTTVNAGTLLINNASGSGTGAGSVTVNNAGTVLGGSGSINAGVNNVALSAGTIAPGAAANTVGALTMTAANVIFTGTTGNLATLAVDISVATADRLVITGNLDLSTTFDRLTVAELATGTLSRYQIVTYTGTLTGIFDNTTLPSGYSIDYSIPNEIDLVDPVPEPATWFAAALALGAIVWHQRHRLARSLARRMHSSIGANWLSLIILASFFIGVASASAHSLQVATETGDLERSAELSLPANAYTNINLSNRQSVVINGAPGETVTLNLQNFKMSGSSTFTLQGTATTNFIINVTKQFSLSGSATIVLSGGVQWNHVFFNVLGKGSDVTLSGHSSLTGIITAKQRTVKLSDHSIVRGEVIANKVVLSGNGQIIQPPVVSPEQPPSQ